MGTAQIQGQEQRALGVWVRSPGAPFLAEGLPPAPVSRLCPGHSTLSAGQAEGSPLLVQGV